MIECPGCGAASAASAKFCSECGSGLEGATQRGAVAEPAAERRQITVTFSDLAGYTAMSETLVAEDVRDVMARIYEAAAELTARYGGRVDKLMGDAVMTVFGDPVAHEDDAERAVRFVLALHERVDEISRDLESVVGRPIALHSGINTGVVVTGALAVEGAAAGPLGDTVNVAARLEGLSEAGEILLGPDTRDLVAGVFELADHGSHELKGKSEPLEVARVIGVKAARGGPSRRLSDFVGRHEELGVILGAVDRVRDGVGSVVSVCAEAGSGKTRLFAEVQGAVGDDVTWLEGRAYPYTENMPYAGLIDLIGRAAGIDDGDSAIKVRAKLDDAVSGLVGDADQVMAPLARLFDVEGEESVNVDREAFQGRLLEAVMALVGALAQRSPTVLCFQDLHWADPSTAAILRTLAARVEAPVVILCNFRPGFELGVEGERTVDLAPLSQRQMRDLTRSLLDGDDPPDQLVNFVLERCDGNPFFAEEIVNRLLETDVVVRNAEAWVLAQPLGSVELPSTIRGLIASRIDSLDPRRRKVLREASVVGRQFLYDLVRSVTDTADEIDPILDGLELADLIRRNQSDPELEYIFKHALTQEVAYDGLLRDERQTLHERVAAAIEAQLEDRLGEFAETLAYHYERSGVPEKAVEFLRLAGRKALERYAIDEADKHFGAAYALLDNDTRSVADDRVLVELILEWALVFYYRSDFGELDGYLERHHEVVAGLGDGALACRWLAWRGHTAYTHLGDFYRSDTLLAQAVDDARAAGDPTGHGYALCWHIWTLWQMGRTANAVAAWQALEPILDDIPGELDRRYCRLKGMAGYGTTLATSGDMDGARRSAAELESIYDSSGNLRALALCHTVLAPTELFLGNIDAAIDHATIARDAAPDPVYRYLASLWRGFLLSLVDDLEGFEQELVDLEKYVHELDMRNWIFSARLQRSLLQMLQGDLSKGQKGLAETQSEMRVVGEHFLLLISELSWASVLARIDTGEVEAELGAALRNPGFVLRHARGAGKKATAELTDLSRRIGESDHGGFRFMVDFELVKLLLHRKDTDGAAEAAGRIRAFLEPHQPAGGLAQLDDALAAHE